MSDEQLSNLQDVELPEKQFPEPLAHLFSQLRPADVEQFANAYQIWTLYKQVDLLSLQITQTRQELQANEELLHLVQPTALALSTLAQMQALGVSDIDLLDRLHARGEAWLDHAMQLLEHCERMDLIQGDYTQWCEHALEGAYDWLSSINEADLTSAENSAEQVEQPEEIKQEQAEVQEESYGEQIETLLLRKLLSETDENIAEESDADIEISPQSTSPEEKEEEIAPPEEALAEPEDEQAENTSDEVASESDAQPVLIADQQDLNQEPHSEIPGTNTYEAAEIEADAQAIATIQKTPELDENTDSNQENTDKYPLLVQKQSIHDPESDERIVETHNTSPDETILDEPDSSLAQEQKNQQTDTEEQKYMLPKKRGSLLRRLFRRFFRFFLRI